MKKKIKSAAFLMLISVLVATGCGTTNAPKNVTEDSVQSKETTNDLADAATNSSESKSALGTVYSYTYHYDGGEYGEDYDEIYSLVLRDGENATFSDEIAYSKVHRNITEYDGVYVKKDSSIRFEYFSMAEAEETQAYVFELDGDTVTDVVSDRAGQSSLAGEYTCDSAEYGELRLVIKDSGRALLFVSGEEYSANLYFIGDRWNLVVYDSAEEFDVDWYVEFEGNTFTYESFSYTDFTKYAGEIEINGDLGVISLKLSDNGDAAADVMVDGTKVRFEGSYYVDNDLEKISSIDLYSEDGYSLNLYVEDIGEELLNYSGSISRPLGAG